MDNVVSPRAAKIAASVLSCVLAPFSVPALYTAALVVVSSVFAVSAVVVAFISGV